MRTTVRIDDELIEELRRRARQENLSTTRVLSRVIRAGLKALENPRRPKRRTRQPTFAMGEALFNVDKALSFAAALEDAETARKIALRK
jgi:hypothetical protein